MTENPEPAVEANRVAERADLLPEESAVGSDDAALQARIVLEDSDARTQDPDRAKAESAQTPDRDGSPGA